MRTKGQIVPLLKIPFTFLVVPEIRSWVCCKNMWVI